MKYTHSLHQGHLEFEQYDTKLKGKYMFKRRKKKATPCHKRFSACEAYKYVTQTKRIRIWNDTNSLPYLGKC